MSMSNPAKWHSSLCKLHRLTNCAQGIFESLISGSRIIDIPQQMRLFSVPMTPCDYLGELNSAKFHQRHHKKQCRRLTVATITPSTRHNNKNTILLTTFVSTKMFIYFPFTRMRTCRFRYYWIKLLNYPEIGITLT